MPDSRKTRLDALEARLTGPNRQAKNPTMMKMEEEFQDNLRFSDRLYAVREIRIEWNEQ
jgi:hypothetical protein